MSSSPAAAWDRFPDEQRIHLRAQRFARVEVARMRLFQSDAVLAGRAGRNLYDALRNSIDAARETFRQSFFAPCSSMVDYLHLELVQTLAMTIRTCLQQLFRPHGIGFCAPPACWPVWACAAPSLWLRGFASLVRAYRDSLRPPGARPCSPTPRTFQDTSGALAQLALA